MGQKRAKNKSNVVKIDQTDCLRLAQPTHPGSHERRPIWIWIGLSEHKTFSATEGLTRAHDRRSRPSKITKDFCLSKRNKSKKALAMTERLVLRFRFSDQWGEL